MLKKYTVDVLARESSNQQALRLASHLRVRLFGKEPWAQSDAPMCVAAVLIFLDLQIIFPLRAALPRFLSLSGGVGGVSLGPLGLLAL
jgi:hypothetical protein